jgi:hypothetical protein
MVEEVTPQQTNELIQQVINKLEDIRALVEKTYIDGKGVNNEFPWIDNTQLEKLLGVHPRTMQAWRDNGSLKFSRIGKKVFYNKRDIEQLLYSKFGRVVKI